MDHKQVLRELRRTETWEPDGVTAEGFSRYCTVHVPVGSARVYLLRLFKMGLASRRKDPSCAITKPPFRYRLSKQGRNYLEHLDEKGKEGREGIDSLEQYRLIRRLRKLIDVKRFEAAMELYEKNEALLTDPTWKMIAQSRYREALEGLKREQNRERGGLRIREEGRQLPMRRVKRTLFNSKGEVLLDRAGQVVYEFIEEPYVPVADDRESSLSGAFELLQTMAETHRRAHQGSKEELIAEVRRGLEDLRNTMMRSWEREKRRRESQVLTLDDVLKTKDVGVKPKTPVERVLELMTVEDTLEARELARISNQGKREGLMAAIQSRRESVRELVDEVRPIRRLRSRFRTV